MSLSQNEGFARVAVAAFATQLNPTIEALSDIRTAVSEAVTNSIVHGYENSSGYIEICCTIKASDIFIIVKDEGKGIENITEAMQPFFTSRPEMDRSGMGFTVMESFMDELSVESEPGRGTIVKMKKTIVPPSPEEEK